jgi:hypothetical protein
MQIQLNFKENPKWDDVLIGSIKKGLAKSSIVIVNNIKASAPAGVSGDLRKSNEYEVKEEGREIFTRIYNTKEYAPFVEFDTRPHWPPISALKDWCRLKLGDEGLAFVIARNISKKGTKGKHFFRDALYNNQDKVKEITVAEIRKVL